MALGSVVHLIFCNTLLSLRLPGKRKKMEENVIRWSSHMYPKMEPMKTKPTPANKWALTQLCQRKNKKVWFQNVPPLFGYLSYIIMCFITSTYLCRNPSEHTVVGTFYFPWGHVVSCFIYIIFQACQVPPKLCFQSNISLSLFRINHSRSSSCKLKILDIFFMCSWQSLMDFELIHSTLFVRQ